MKILFFGRGVISTQYAWAFEQAGHTVDFYVRKGRKETFGSSIKLEMWDARKGKKLIKESWNIKLHEEILPNYDLIIVSVNTEQLPGAAQFLSTAAGNAPILIFNNIWQDLKSSIAPLSMNNVVFGFPGAGGGIADNKLRGGFLKMVFLEKPRAGTEHINNKVRELFESAHFKISWKKDMQNWLWNHFAMNAAMEAEVLKRGSFSALMNHNDSFSNVGLNMRELIPVLKARGAKLDAISLLLTKIPPGLLGTLFNKVIFAKGSLPRLFVEYNNSKAGFAVLEVVREAKKVSIPLTRHTIAFENTEYAKEI
ncbi:ketopantoate reductase family protein [Paenibacillus sacheonensis]|uniref:Ketopantoate reductase family protein n=1 Tax=Paenibacillus sacheonensis TaxID=742054 RepID=A0A7X4YQN3_9BACL|nr:2-dehydropantoate 2-reductase N-terminal domain-containing protein [Paenibacillus sacheonensis]MBM7567892.1 2-dehydropantoate 2-reductase [Paenibacillus sacheonensis]NBC70777.1 ketopantoate reductase family protein [Paenibacillus sacheonensis]